MRFLKRTLGLTKLTVMTKLTRLIRRRDLQDNGLHCAVLVCTRSYGALLDCPGGTSGKSVSGDPNGQVGWGSLEWSDGQDDQPR